MSCTSEKKSRAWVIYDAKEQYFIELTSKQFGEMLIDRPVKLMDRKIWNKEKGKLVWIDGILNSSYFK